MTLWTWFVGTKIGRGLVGAVLVIAGLVTALAVAFVKGKHAQAGQDKAADAQSLAEAAQEAVNAANVRKDVENETAKLPDAPAQQVATADPATAAGRLRDDGWVRDDSGQDGNG